jgi:hypothetical protein
MDLGGALAVPEFARANSPESFPEAGGRGPTRTLRPLPSAVICLLLYRMEIGASVCDNFPIFSRLFFAGPSEGTHEGCPNTLFLPQPAANRTFPR